MSDRVSLKVEKLLQSNEKLRDSDIYLVFAYWQQQGLQLTDAQKQQLSGLTPAESITRARRALRSKYPGSDAVEEQRFRKMEEYIDEYGRPAMRFL